VIAERSFHAQIGVVDVALEHEFRVSRHFQIDGFALHEFHGFAAQQARKQEFIDYRRQRCGCGIR
jgi:hypothetical protein